MLANLPIAGGGGRVGCRMATPRRLHDHSCHCVLVLVGFADRRTVFLSFALGYSYILYGS